MRHNCRHVTSSLVFSLFHNVLLTRIFLATSVLLINLFADLFTCILLYVSATPILLLVQAMCVFGITAS